jgi:hypothetical protein
VVGLSYLFHHELERHVSSLVAVKRRGPQTHTMRD